MVSCYIFNLNFQAGEVSCGRTDSSCPTVKCSHPAKQKGECCPTCQGQYLKVKSNVFFCCLFVQIDSRNLKIEIMILTLFVSVLTDCEFEQEVHADGKVFVPAGSGPCLKCRCKVSVWGIACRKCWILEGTEKSQQKDINKSGREKISDLISVMCLASASQMSVKYYKKAKNSMHSCYLKSNTDFG